MKSYTYKIIILFFLSLIFIGVVLLSLPWVVKQKVSFVDRLFIATSAVCVTGLTTVDISSTFNFFGQLIIILLIQSGGLGYMLLASIVIILFGRISIAQKSIVGESLSISELTKISQMTNLIIKIIFMTLLFELFGIVALLPKFFLSDKINFIQSLWYSIFHSVSAFCNAGFSLFADNLERYKGDIVINLVIPMLIIAGGLGFFVWINVFEYFKKEENLQLHTKIVLIMTTILILSCGLLIFLLNQKIFVVNKLPLKTQIFISWFQSVTPRTAGFDTFPINQLSGLTILLIIILMFIGASPGGTGGGIKTTTAFVLVSSIYSYLRGERTVNVFKRRIEQEIVIKSFTIFFVCFLWIVLVSCIIYWINNTLYFPKFSYKEIFFETVSAFGTVGLSLGITPYIDNYSKILLIITMLFGRIGGVTLLSSLLTKEPKEIKYLEEPVAVG
jgi:trk system potassium uptake protein TrkH